MESLPEAAAEFVKAVGSGRIFAFHGGMGVGKTTFIAEVCRTLGVEDDSVSPTFSIVNEYYSPERSETIYHFDCYRLDSVVDALEIGAEDYLFSGSRCFIEWPEVMEALLPAGTIDVYMSADPVTGERLLKFDI